MEIKLKKKLMIIVFAVGLALIGGLAGGWIYNYWFGQMSNIRQMTDKKISDFNGNSAQVVITDAKRVVVEQDARAGEVIDSTEKVVVGIFKKKADNNYDLIGAQASGVLITSDGWLASNWQIKDKKNTVANASDYVVITKDKKIYNLDKLVADDFSGLTFAHIKGANSLPVIGFGQSLGISRGETIFLVGWLKTVKPAILTESRRRDAVLSSDQPFKTLSLSVSADGELVAVDLSGRVIGWINKDKQVVSVDYIINAMNYLLANKKLTPTVLGVNYLNSDYYIKNKQPEGALISKDKKGVAVIANSPAAKAGIKEGDVIYSVDDKEIAYGIDLADVIASYQVDEKVMVKYYRGTDKKEAMIILSGK